MAVVTQISRARPTYCDAQDNGEVAVFIRSERLFLRPVWPEDWQDLYSLVADEPLVLNLALGHGIAMPGEVRRFAGQPQDRRCPDFAITHVGQAKRAELVGRIGLHKEGGLQDEGGLHHVAGGCGRSDIVFDCWVAKSHCGHGYATEAARALLSLARVFGYRRIKALHAVDNTAAARLLTKLGFRPIRESVSTSPKALSNTTAAQIQVVDLGSAADWTLLSDWAAAPQITRAG